MDTEVMGRDAVGVETVALDSQGAVMRVVNMERPKPWIEEQLLQVTR